MKPNYKIFENEFCVLIKYSNGTGNRYDKILETSMSLTIDDMDNLDLNLSLKLDEEDDNKCPDQFSAETHGY